jgi:hypothetical protein
LTEPLSQLATLMEPVARILLGEPNRGLSSKGELRYGTRGSMSVDTVSAETRHKISEAKRGHVSLSAETRAKISAKLKGRPKSIETRRRMRDAQLMRSGVAHD